VTPPRHCVSVYLTDDEVSDLDAAREDRSRSAFLALLLRQHVSPPLPKKKPRTMKSSPEVTDG